MNGNEHVMTISSNGQVSIPATTRARWDTRQVIVADLGDRVVMRPLSAQPVRELRGKYRDRGVNSERSRAQERRAAAARERSR